MSSITKILSLTHRKCRSRPNIYEYFVLFYRRINRAVLNCIRSNLLTYLLPLQREIGLAVYSRSNLIGVTYIHLSSIHWPVRNILNAPTKKHFFYKKITQQTDASSNGKVTYPRYRWFWSHGHEAKTQNAYSDLNSNGAISLSWLNLVFSRHEQRF